MVSLRDSTPLFIGDKLGNCVPTHCNVWNCSDTVYIYIENVTK